MNRSEQEWEDMMLDSAVVPDDPHEAEHIAPFLVPPEKAHPIPTGERGHVRCDMPKRGTDAFEFCPDPAVMRWTELGRVHHYCAECWVAPEGNGGPSPAETAGVDLPDALDFERRWLAECRAHGETQRKLEAALARIEASDKRAPKDGWAAQPAKMRGLVSNDDAYMARDHLESIISKPEGK